MSISVSIVEDDSDVRTTLARLIHGSPGYRCVSQHGSGEVALQEIPKVRPDVVLMDINLPGMSGVECVRKLKQLLPATQVMMLTAYEDTDNIFNALKAGANGYLLKRTPRAELLEAIRDVHRGGSPMSAHIARKEKCSIVSRRAFSTRKSPTSSASVTKPFIPTFDGFTKSSKSGRAPRPWPSSCGGRAFVGTVCRTCAPHRCNQFW
jgi:DNA-binding NarL/FixJ family response regulator